MPSDAQDRVAAFVADHDLETDPEYRVLDLVSEVGEIAKEIETSTGYGSDPAAADVAADELGDALFALLATAECVDVDAGDALDAAIEKYERRLDADGTAGSGA